MNSQKPLISIVIANYNSEKYIINCLISVFKETKVLFELIIVDSSSKDTSVYLIEQKLKSRKNAYLIKSKKNRGAAYARNIGAKKSKGKYLVFLDCDTIVGKNWLEKAIKFLEKNKNIGAGQLKIIQLDKKTFDSAGEKLTPFGFLAERAQNAKDKGQFDDVEPIFSGKTAAMIVRKKIFQKLEGFDEDFFMYWEEPDLCWRIWKLGYKIVFLPMGTVYHAYSAKIKQVSRDWDLQITYLGCRNHIFTIIKNGEGFSGLEKLFSVCTAWIVFLCLFILKLDFAKAKSILRAFYYIFSKFKLIYRKRNSIKKILGYRFFSDSEWFSEVKDQRKADWYLGKAFAYLTGKPY